MTTDRPVRPEADTRAMIAGMTPQLKPGSYHFCPVTDAGQAARLLPLSLASFAEEEGLSLVLKDQLAAEEGIDCRAPMRLITLMMFTSLEGVGLTAAISTALAGAGIACNIVAGYHHDHVFVPADAAERAVSVLEDLSARTAGT